MKKLIFNCFVLNSVDFKTARATAEVENANVVIDTTRFFIAKMNKNNKNILLFVFNEETLAQVSGNPAAVAKIETFIIKFAYDYSYMNAQIEVHVDSNLQENKVVEVSNPRKLYHFIENEVGNLTKIKFLG